VDVVRAILVALRYGVMAGITSSAIMVIGWFLLLPLGHGVPEAVLPAGVIMVMIAGEYSTTWRTRLRRVGELKRLPHRAFHPHHEPAQRTAAFARCAGA
jgi:hypothetical protein